MEAGFDLVEIAPEAQPPVARIVDFKKFKYQLERKEKEARRHRKETELKEVRFSPFIGEHDFQTAIDKVKRFIKEGDIVKISIIFTGRQMAHTEFGPKLLVRILDEVKEIAEKEREEKFEGRRLITIIRPTKKTKGERANETQNQEGSSQTL